MQRYGCVMTTWMKNSGPKETGGAWSLATSPDLKRWTDHGAIIHPGDMNEPECPQMFALGGRWYALASIHRGHGENGGVGKPMYWTSKSPLGPWPKRPAGALDGQHNCAAQVAFDGKTPLLFGWIPLTPSKPGKAKSWGGHLALPREIYALPDGSLGSRLPSALLEKFAGLPWRKVPGFTITSKPRALGKRWVEEWRDVAATLTLQMPATVKEVRVRIAPLGEVVLTHDRLRILDATGKSRSELETGIPATRAVTLRLFVEADIAEVFVDDRYSLVARLPLCQGKRCLTIRTDGNRASISRMHISALCRTKDSVGPI